MPRRSRRQARGPLRSPSLRRYTRKSSALSSTPVFSSFDCDESRTSNRVRGSSARIPVRCARHLGQDVAGDSLLVELAGIEILHRASASLSFSQGSFLQALSDLLHMLAKILQVDVVRPEIVHHPLRSTDGTQVSAEY